MHTTHKNHNLFQRQLNIQLRHSQYCTHKYAGDIFYPSEL